MAMDATAIVQTLGALLMSPEDDRIQGKNQSLFAEPVDKFFNPFRQRWMKVFLSSYEAAHTVDVAESYESYCKILLDYQKKYELQVALDTSEEDTLIRAGIWMIHHRKEPHNGYRQWEPVVEIDVEKNEDGRAVIALFFEDEEYHLCIGADEFEQLIIQLCSLPLLCDSVVINEHYSSFLPKELQSSYISTQITADLGHCSWGDGQYTYGHEVTLALGKSHEFVMAYLIQSALADEERYGTVMKTAKTSFDSLMEIVSIVPELIVVSQHGDDFGIEIKRMLSRKVGRLMDRIEEWSEGKETTLDMVEDVMRFYGRDDASPEEILEWYRQGMSIRKQKGLVMKSMLKTRKHHWKLYTYWDHARLYVSGERMYDRELYVVLPYDWDMKQIKRVLLVENQLNALSEKLKSFKDYETSVGVFPVTGTPEC